MPRDPISILSGSQLPDGGWPYRGRSSWTEPTAMALIALGRHGVENDTTRRGREWLRRAQRADGGWRPRPSVDQSTWVTSVALLVPGLESGARARGIDWLLTITSRESWTIERLRTFLRGGSPEIPDTHAGWPWFPETAGWVTPTVMSILALRQALMQTPGNPRYRDRIESATKFLLVRRCPDGGWNHGSSKALGYELLSYPETTGQVLVALRGVASPVVESALACATQHLARAASVEAVAWLRLGLAAHGRHSDRSFPPAHSALDVALQLIAEAAVKGTEPFVLPS